MDSQNVDFKHALDSLTRYLTARDHSEQELRTKLGRRFGPALIEQVLTFAGQCGLLIAPEALAAKVSAEYERRKKSYLYIQDQLAKRGLPPTPVDIESEIEKIRHLVHSKFGRTDNLAYEQITKIDRFLRYRGFQESLIHKVLNEKSEE
jgi:SOS response regulatory protein OraA/RecX